MREYHEYRAREYVFLSAICGGGGGDIGVTQGVKRKQPRCALNPRPIAYTCTECPVTHDGAAVRK